MMASFKRRDAAEIIGGTVMRLTENMTMIVVSLEITGSVARSRMTA
jgi:hypothetical protein